MIRKNANPEISKKKVTYVAKAAPKKKFSFSAKSRQCRAPHTNCRMEASGHQGECTREKDHHGDHHCPRCGKNF